MVKKKGPTSEEAKQPASKSPNVEPDPNAGQLDANEDEDEDEDDSQTEPHKRTRVIPTFNLFRRNGDEDTFVMSVKGTSAARQCFVLLKRIAPDAESYLYKKVEEVRF